MVLDLYGHNSQGADLSFSRNISSPHVLYSSAALSLSVRQPLGFLVTPLWLVHCRDSGNVSWIEIKVNVHNLEKLSQMKESLKPSYQRRKKVGSSVVPGADGGWGYPKRYLTRCLSIWSENSDKTDSIGPKRKKEGAWKKLEVGTTWGFMKLKGRPREAIVRG